MGKETHSLQYRTLYFFDVFASLQHKGNYQKQEVT